jgi:hypothetical protein
MTDQKVQGRLWVSWVVLRMYAVQSELVILPHRTYLISDEVPTIIKFQSAGYRGSVTNVMGLISTGKGEKLF